MNEEYTNNGVINDGVLLGSRPDDYAGGTIPYEVRNPSGDWTPYLPVGEIQRGKVDFMDCTIRTDTNVIEIQEKFMTGIERNYNDREVAQGAGVTPKGAYCWQGPEYIRKTGLANQETFPDSKGDWNEQYSPPSPEVRAKLDAEKTQWKEKWAILHEDIPFSKPSLQYHLKHAPLQIVVPGHSVTGIFSPTDVDKIFDSYEPFVKYVPGYYPGPIVFAKKIVLYKKAEAIPDEHLLVDIKYLEGGKQVEKLKRALQKLGWMPDMTQYPGYDLKMAELILNFIKANKDYLDWNYWSHVFHHRGKFVDSYVRCLINKSL